MSFAKPFTLSLAVLALSSTAFARGGGGNGARHEMRMRISDEVVNKLAAATGLDAVTAARCKAIIDKYAPQLEAEEQAIAQARRQLRQLVAARSNDATTLNQAIDGFERAKAAHEQVTQQRSKELRGAVTPSQYAMGILERPRIEKEVRQQLMSAAGKDED